MFARRIQIHSRDVFTLTSVVTTMRDEERFFPAACDPPGAQLPGFREQQAPLTCRRLNNISNLPRGPATLGQNMQPKPSLLLQPPPSDQELHHHASLHRSPTVVRCVCTMLPNLVAAQPAGSRPTSTVGCLHPQYKASASSDIVFTRASASWRRVSRDANRPP